MTRKKGVKGTSQIKNPDGSKCLVSPGETHHFGGRIVHIGSAGLPPDVKFTFDPSVRNPFQKGRRQRDSVRAMADAFDTHYEQLQAEPMDKAALQIELDFTLKRHADVSKVGFYETAIMSTQRWKIVALPMNVVKKVIEIANMYRDALRTYLPLVEVPIPNPQVLFTQMLPKATEENRAEILALLDSLLEEPDHINCYVYSEPDCRITCAWRGFHRATSSKAFLNELPLTASAEEIIEYGQERAGLVDLTVCYWCEKPAMSCKMMTCRACRAVSYCSRECQTHDWKAFHKKECKHIQSGAKTREDLGLSISRLTTLKSPGAQRESLPLQLAASDDRTSVWRGDLMFLYLINTENGTLGEKSTGFPRGLYMRPREL